MKIISKNLNKILIAIHSTFTELVLCLQQEQHTLKKRDKDLLFQVVGEKKEILGKINRLIEDLSEQHNMLNMLNGKPGGTSISDLFKSNDLNLHILWEEIHNLAECAQSLNYENDNIVQLNHSFFVEYLNKLKELRMQAVGYQKSNASTDRLTSNILINRMS
ncbi:MAG: flagellar protein FlgN [Calditrichaeota bacterium]|nr:MAG: flagellar protein FlgN [Calditrichota bacterium]